jgi:hypothetical protein
LSTLAGRSCLGTDSEWATTCWTSWYPGAGRQQPSYRAGVESHYASFVCFEAPDSVTHAEVAAQVEDAYQRALRGNRSGEGVMSEARNFGGSAGPPPSAYGSLWPAAMPLPLSFRSCVPFREI